MSAANTALLTAAATTGLGFRLSTDNAPHEFKRSDFPAMVAYDRRFTGINSLLTNHSEYYGDWRYYLVIITLFNDDDPQASHTAHETQVMRFLSQLHSDVSYPYFELAADVAPREASIGDHAVIVSEIELKRASHYDLDLS